MFSRLVVFTVVMLLPGMCWGWTGKGVEAVSGDEIKVLKPSGRIERVRLYGIDTPIEPQPYGKESRDFATKMIRSKKVEVTPYGRDRFDRVIGEVTVDGVSLVRELLRNGLAWWYSKYVPWEGELADLEKAARTAHVGIWSTPRPVPPWEYQPLPKGEPADSTRTYARGSKGPFTPRITGQRELLGQLEGPRLGVLERIRRGASAVGRPTARAPEEEQALLDSVTGLTQSPSRVIRNDGAIVRKLKNAATPEPDPTVERSPEPAPGRPATAPEPLEPKAAVEETPAFIPVTEESREPASSFTDPHGTNDSESDDGSYLPGILGNRGAVRRQIMKYLVPQ